MHTPDIEGKVDKLFKLMEVSDESKPDEKRIVKILKQISDSKQAMDTETLSSVINRVRLFSNLLSNQPKIEKRVTETLKVLTH